MASPTIATKTCPRCRDVKPLDAFGRDATKSGDRQSRCSKCHARRMREAHWRRRGITESEFAELHRERDHANHMRALAGTLGAKWCSACWRVKAIAEFSAHSSHADGRRTWCRDCAARYNARWRAEARNTQMC